LASIIEDTLNLYLFLILAVFSFEAFRFLFLNLLISSIIFLHYCKREILIRYSLSGISWTFGIVC